MTSGYRSETPENDKKQTEETGMTLTMNQAAKECGRAKSTLSKAIKAGKMTAEKQEDGSYRIDPAELFRVFPPKEETAQSLPGGNAENGSNSTLEMAIKIGRLEVELEAERQKAAMLQDRLEDTQAQRDEWQDQAKKLLIANQNEPEKPRKKFLGIFG